MSNFDSDVVERARELAAELARSMLPRQRDEENVASILKKDGVFKQIKECIKMARKPRLRTIEQFLCDSCDKIIQKPEDGFIIHGNIYTANTTHRGGLIGDNFPEVQEGEKIDPNSVMKTVLCRSCFLLALGIEADCLEADRPKTKGMMRKKNIDDNLTQQLTSMLSQTAMRRS